MNYSKIILGGRLVARPELKQTQTGKSMTSFTVAVNDFVNGEQKTSFFICKAFGNTAELVCQRFEKGSGIMVDGSPRMEKWQDKDGNAHESFSVLCSGVFFVDGKPTTAQAPEEAKAENRPAFEAPKAAQQQTWFAPPSNDADLPF